MNKAELCTKIKESLISGKAKEVEALVKQGLAEKVPANELLNGGLIAGMDVVGKKFREEEFYIPEVQKEHRTHFTVGIGCTGGRHRSVAIAAAVAQGLQNRDVRIHVMHRDAQRGEG